MILIKNTLFNKQVVDILIKDRKIQRIKPKIEVQSDEDLEIIDGNNTAVFPSFVNGHTHSPMVLLRGYGDDMLLAPWLEERIWPVEAKLQGKDFEIGYKLAFMEMIAGGTTAFNEMYMHPEIALKALEGIPLKAHICYPLIDGGNEALGRQQIKACEEFFNTIDPPKGVTIGIAAHSIYATSEFSLKWIKNFVEKRDIKVHIHLSETEKEVKDCMALHNGISPVEYLDKIGFLHNRVLAAHGVWLSKKDIDILANRGVTVIHNPVSNMKLATGKALPFNELNEKNVPILLGTDGASSNNNLDMLEEMKVAALLQKHEYRDPTRLTVNEVFNMATLSGAKTLNTGGGKIEEGHEADLILVDLDTPEMIPSTNVLSNLVYSATRACIKTVLCGGKVLMKNGVIEGAKNCRKEASICARELLLRKESC